MRDVGIVDADGIARVARGGGVGDDLRDDGRVVDAGKHHLRIADQRPPDVDRGDRGHGRRGPSSARGRRNVRPQPHRLGLAHGGGSASTAVGCGAGLIGLVADPGSAAGQIGEAAAELVAIAVAQTDRRRRRAVGRRRDGQRVAIRVARRRARQLKERRVADDERAVLPAREMLRQPGEAVGGVQALRRRGLDRELVVEIGGEDRGRGRGRKRSGARAPAASIENARHSDSQVSRAGSSGMRTSTR